MKLPYPFVTVVVPVRNEIKYIARNLQSILQQDYPAQQTEILFVDGMSDDGTDRFIETAAQQTPNLRLLKNRQGIVPYALNIAIREAKGDIFIRVDGHSEIAPDYVTLCVQHLQESGADAVGGPIDTIGETPVARAIAIAMSSWFGVGGSAFRTIKGKTMWVDTVAFPAYWRKTVAKIGLFDQELVRNQDDEYNYRLLKAGGKILLAAEIQSTYYSRASFRRLWKQYYQYGFWKVRVLQKHPRQMRWRQFVPLVLVLSMLTSFLIPATTVLLVGAYAALAAWFAASACRTQGWRYFHHLLVAFPTMHFSYGFGFLVGLVKFAGRWGDKTGGTPIWHDPRSLTDAG